MKDHRQIISSIESIQERMISRRGMLMSIAGLVVAGCAQTPATSSPISTSTQSTAGITGAASVEGTKQASSSQAPAAGKTLLTYKGHTGIVKVVGWSSDGKRIASAGTDKTVQIWDAASGKTLRIYRDHAMQVGALAWSPDSKYIVSGSSDIDQKGHNAAHIWDATSGQKLVTYTGHSNAITAIAWTSDGTRIISTSYDGTIQVWDALSGKMRLTMTLMKENDISSPVSALALSPDSQHLVAGVNSIINGIGSRPVKIFQSETGNEVLTYHDTIKGAQALSWSPDGGSIAMSQGGRSIQIWSPGSGKDTTSLQATNTEVLALAWSPDNQHLVSGGGSTQAVLDDNQAQVWDMSHKKVMIYLGHNAPIVSVCWSPDGTRIASASFDQTVQIWQAV